MYNNYVGFILHGSMLIHIASIPQCIISEFPDTLGQWGHIRFWLSISGNTSEKLHCGNVVNMPYCLSGLIRSLQAIQNILDLTARFNVTKYEILLLLEKMTATLVVRESNYEWIHMHNKEIENKTDWWLQRIWYTHDSVLKGHITGSIESYITSMQPTNGQNEFSIC